MSRLSAAIDVAAEYAYHLYKEDGVPKRRAIAIGAAAVVRATRSGAPGRLTDCRVKDAGVGISGETIMGVGSLLSAVGFIKRLVTGG
jgi:hypothetical protein